MTATTPVWADIADPRCRELLAFWFGEDADEAAVMATQGARWFRGGEAVDAAIRSRFAGLREAAVDGRLDGWLDSAHGRLALVLLIDQFSRNLFRGDRRAFEHDGLALDWCKAAVERGLDRPLRGIERMFLYLPLEHSEVLADQDHSVALFTTLRDGAGAATRARFETFLDYALRHREVIARFGRFPHRNAALGRASTDAELAYLSQPGAGF